MRRRRQLAKALPGFWASAFSYADPDCCFEGYNQLYRGALVYRSTLGRATYLTEGARVSHSSLGRYCSIGHQAMVGGLGRHPTDSLSTHPAFYSSAEPSGLNFGVAGDFDELPWTDIGHDVWIGARAIVLDGRRVGNGAIIGAGAVVTRDVEPYAIVAGLPARVVRYRFAPETVRELCNWPWWELSLLEVAAIARQLAGCPLVTPEQVLALRAGSSVVGGDR